MFKTFDFFLDNRHFYFSISGVNPQPAEFLKWNNPASIIFCTVHYHFYEYKDDDLKMASQQY